MLVLSAQKIASIPLSYALSGEIRILQCIQSFIKKPRLKFDSDWSRPVHYISIKLAAHVTRAL